MHSKTPTPGRVGVLISQGYELRSCPWAELNRSFPPRKAIRKGPHEWVLHIAVPRQTLLL